MTTQTQPPEEYCVQHSILDGEFEDKLKFLRDAGYSFAPGKNKDLPLYLNVYYEVEAKKRALQIEHNIELNLTDTLLRNLDVKYNIEEYFVQYNKMSFDDKDGISTLNTEYKMHEYLIRRRILIAISNIVGQLTQEVERQLPVGEEGSDYLEFLVNQELGLFFFSSLDRHYAPSKK